MMSKGIPRSFRSVLIVFCVVWLNACVQLPASEDEPSASPSVIQTDSTPRPTVAPFPTPTRAPAPTATPAPTPTSGVGDPNAGKISLWLRRGMVYPANFDYDAVVFLPKDYGTNPSRLYPVIFSFHGLGGSVMDVNHTTPGGNREGFVKQVWNTTLSNTFPAIVIAGQVTPPGTNPGSTWWQAGLTRRLIEDALTKFKIDPKRVVVTGLSAGGAAVNDLITSSSDLLAGAMPGAFNEDPFTYSPCLLATFPVWAFGNNNDGVFQAYDWQPLEPKVKACSNYAGHFKLSVYNNNCGHGCWDTHWASPEVQQWLVNQVRN